MDISNLVTAAELSAFGQVVLIDVVLAGDNAIVVGALAAGLPPAQRKKVILIGIIAALVLRVIFALGVSWLLSVVGLILAGGLLLLWVAWKMWRELRHDGIVPGNSHDDDGGMGIGDAAPLASSRSFAKAAWAVALADVSMSLDNVLAVAGAAREHPGIMVAGLVLAVALMGAAANIIAVYIERFRWIAYVGLIVIVYVAGKMIWEGWHEVSPHVMPLFG